MARIRDIIWENFHQHLHDQVIAPLKQGMTNDSYYLELDGRGYVLRLNGAGSEKLIDRQEEVATYRTIASSGIAEPVIAISPTGGYKISELLSGVHNCRPQDMSEVQACMKKLRWFHELSLPYHKPFDILQKIAFYEDLRKRPSEHDDYAIVREAVFRLAPLRHLRSRPLRLCHIDAVYDNFLLTEDGRVYLVDWEYAAGCDPLMDPAMFSIYAGYRERRALHLLDIYLGHPATREERYRYTSYMAAGGLLWSNWCEYKETFGEIFGSYAAMQYRYARECVRWAAKWEA